MQSDHISVYIKANTTRSSKSYQVIRIVDAFSQPINLPTVETGVSNYSSKEQIRQAVAAASGKPEGDVFVLEAENGKVKLWAITEEYTIEEIIKEGKALKQQGDK